MKSCVWLTSTLAGALSACVAMWSLRLPTDRNDLSHIVHGYGLTPVWMRSCVLRSPLCEKRFSQ